MTCPSITPYCTEQEIDNFYKYIRWWPHKTHPVYQSSRWVKECLWWVFSRKLALFNGTELLCCLSVWGPIHSQRCHHKCWNSKMETTGWQHRIDQQSAMLFHPRFIGFEQLLHWSCSAIFPIYSVLWCKSFITGEPVKIFFKWVQPISIAVVSSRYGL